MQLIHIDHPNIPAAIRNAFVQKVTAIASWLQIDPNWLMQVMYAESRLKASAQNRQGGRLIAAGLLQWTKASGVPGAPASMLSLNHLQQLDKVREYFAPYRGRMYSYFDVYLVTFFPAGVGKGDDYVFSTKNLSAALIAKQNPAVNINKDGRITMKEFKQYVWNSTPEGVRGLVFKAQQVIEDVKEEAKQIITVISNEPGKAAAAVAGIGTILAFFFS
ncbi:MAG: hypothetical protein BGO70_16510 [Bacteroidetes bacterium 43-93]|nr:hypothetical protein [Bacteroidota bacterium]OJX01365.1 MAG: hypothetical protein BGO70_16510 [Bacteroidetes bacterium 43-93]